MIYKTTNREFDMYKGETHTYIAFHNSVTWTEVFTALNNAGYRDVDFTGCRTYKGKVIKVENWS